jgi:hypothetical protein
LFARKWLELESVTLSKVSQVHKDRGCIFSLICIKLTKDKCIHKYNMIIYRCIHIHLSI